MVADWEMVGEMTPGAAWEGEQPHHRLVLDSRPSSWPMMSICPTQELRQVRELRQVQQQREDSRSQEWGGAAAVPRMLVAMLVRLVEVASVMMARREHC
jgi:hypothetical protein